MKSNYHMTKHGLWIAFVLPALCSTVHAQTVKSVPDTSKLAYNEISQKLGFYVYPAKSQTKQKQKGEEFECYQWASEQSGIDPLNLPKVEAAPAKSGPNGSAVGGAARGAAAGVAIGAIAGDAGKGAAIGAAAGGMRGVSKGRKKNEQANNQSQQDATNKEAEIKNSYLNAFKACMEGKGYTVSKSK